MSTDRDNQGFSPAAATAIGALLDGPAEERPWHLRVVRKFSGDASFCGDSSQWVTDTHGAITCAECKAESERRRAAAEHSLLKRLAKTHGPLHVSGLDTDTRRRLTAAGLAKQVGGGLWITADGRERLKGVG